MNIFEQQDIQNREGETTQLRHYTDTSLERAPHLNINYVARCVIRSPKVLHFRHNVTEAYS